MQHLNGSSSNSTQWIHRDLASSSLLGLCFLLGIPGNVAVVVVILRRFKMENFTLHLMLNLAASDILCLISLPVWIYSLLCGWTLSGGLCKFLSFLIYSSLYSGVLTVTLMSVHRYLLVLYPLQWAKLGKRGERALLLTLWTLAFSLSSPAVATQDIVEDGTKQKCWRITTSDEQRAAVVLCETLLGFVAPFSILVTSYFCLHKKVNQTAFFRDKRMTRLVTRIVVTFFVLWIPVHLVNVVDILAICLKSPFPFVSAKLSAFRKLSEEIVKSFTFLNSCVNPFLYAFASRSLCQSANQPERVDHGIQTSNVQYSSNSPI